MLGGEVERLQQARLDALRVELHKLCQAPAGAVATEGPAARPQARVQVAQKLAAAAGAGAPVCGFCSIRVYARIRVAALEVHAEKFSFFGHARIYPSAARGVKRLVASGVGIVQLVSR